MSRDGTSSLVSRARNLARQSHEQVGQTRKSTGAPYIVHPTAVVEIVRSVPHTQHMLAAAWLHDTIEDTHLTLADIEIAFGTHVATLVDMLTDVSTRADGNRATRKEIDRQHTSRASPEAKTIKLADLIDNVRSISRHEPAFAPKYIAEKRRLLHVLGEGDPTLWHEASRIVHAEDVDARL